MPSIVDPIECSWFPLLVASGAVMHRLRIALVGLAGFVALSIAAVGAKADGTYRGSAKDCCQSWSWTGVYIGVHAGYAFGDIDTPVAFDFVPTEFNGWLGGGRIGANYQLGGRWVAGVELDWSRADITTRQDRFDGVDLFRLNSLATLRARLGYAWDRYLLYATGGVARGEMTIEGREFGPAALAVSPFGLRDQDSQKLTGYAVGGGIETAVLHNFTVNVDYLAVGLGKETFTFVNPLGTSSGDVGWRGQTFRLGFNWLLH
jgi:outer membrane immunogenic protein